MEAKRFIGWSEILVGLLILLIGIFTDTGMLTADDTSGRITILSILIGIVIIAQGALNVHDFHNHHQKYHGEHSQQVQHIHHHHHPGDEQYRQDPNKP